MHFQAFEKMWTIEQPSNHQLRWKEYMQKYLETRRCDYPPYWLYCWPSSVVLAEWMVYQQEYIKGKLCIDLGCGLGFNTLVGQWLGAKVIGVDYSFEALTYAQKNAYINEISQLGWVAMDWKNPAFYNNPASYIFCSDIIYDEKAVEPVLELYEALLAEDGIIWIADQRREAYPVFLDALKDSGWNCKQLYERYVKGSRPLPKFKRIYVDLWEITR